MRHSQYRGVTRATRNPNKPWKAQICAGGKTFFIGNFADENEAAEAFDNVAFYLNCDGKLKAFKLNFPEDYRADSSPPPGDAAMRLLTKIPAALGASGRSSGAQSPDHETLRHRVGIIEETIRGMKQQHERLGDYALQQVAEIKSLLGSEEVA